MKPDRALLVFCEGRHDVVFVQRALGRVAGFTYTSENVADLPTPLGKGASSQQSFIAKRIAADRSAEQLSATNRPMRPSFESVLKGGEGNAPWIVLLNRGTDGFGVRAQRLVDDLTQVSAPDFDLQKWAVAILVDGDDLGAERRAAGLLEEMKSWENRPKTLAHGVWSAASGGPVGLFAFGRGADRKGTLDEDLAEMVAKYWPEPYGGAEIYIDQQSKADYPVTKKKSARLKAVMNVAGQLYFPGDPLSRVIAQDPRGRGLPADVFDTALAKELAAFFQAVPWADPVGESTSGKHETEGKSSGGVGL